MKRIKIKIHPLFWILGVILIFLGEGYLFLAYIFTAVVHEFAHSIAASYYNCRTRQITLYPFGAVLYGEFSDLKPSEEIIVAVSGPLINLITAVLFTALWWIMPELYIYTDVIVMVNVSIALFNLLPVYPLDGGRILMSCLKIKTGTKNACKIVKAMGLVCCGVFVTLYIMSMFSQVNYTFAVAAVFLLCSVLEGSESEALHSVIYPPLSDRVTEKKFILISGEVPLYQLLRQLCTQYYYVIQVTDGGGNTVGTVEHKDLEKLLLDCDIDTKLKDIRFSGKNMHKTKNYL
jgi:stage IV sporulation protein FB